MAEFAFERYSHVAVGKYRLCTLHEDKSQVGCDNEVGQRWSSLPGTTAAHRSLSVGEFHGCALESETGERTCWGDLFAHQ